MSIIITTGTISQAVAVSLHVPELHDPYPESEYEKRISHIPHLILIAKDDDQPVAFKVGYQRDDDGSFYSWMGGVIPSHRNRGLAQQLAKSQEDWALSKGYSHIRFKTRNRLKAMLSFALGNGFNIIEVDLAETIDENRIWLEKKL